MKNKKQITRIYWAIVAIYLFQYVFYLYTYIPPKEQTMPTIYEAFVAEIDYICIRLMVVLFFILSNYFLYNISKSFNYMVILPIALMRLFNEFVYIYTNIEINNNGVLFIEFTITTILLTLWRYTLKRF